MASNFFIDKKLRKIIEKDIKKRKDIEDKIIELQKQLEQADSKIENDLDEFYKQIDNDTVFAILNYYEEHSKTEKKKNLVKEIEERFKGSNLKIEDTLNLIDWYEQMCDDYNNKI